MSMPGIRDVHPRRRRMPRPGEGVCAILALALLLSLPAVGRAAACPAGARVTPPFSPDSEATQPRPVAADSLEARIVAGLPGYVPEQPVRGTISIWGHGNINLPWMHHLIREWEKGFQAFHPGVSIDYQMHGTSSGIPPLFTGAGDIGILGEEILARAARAFEKATGYPPTGVEIATGSLDVRNFDYAQMFFVHRDNPIQELTLDELASIFSHDDGRGTRAIRTWDELGLDGRWAGQKIVPYGWAIDDSFAYYISHAVFGSNHRWTVDLNEYAHIYCEDRSIYDHGQQILDALEQDVHGIAISNIRYAGPNARALRISKGPGSPYYAATKENLIFHRYPLTRTIPAVINRVPGMPVEPKVREFLSFILSREGQTILNEDGRYLPLSPQFLKEQRRKIQ